MTTDGFREQRPEDGRRVRDTELLRRYADEKSESAFGELVRRQVNLVYSIALRQCGGDAHLAEDVTQRVFTDLARRASSLSGYTVLGGWLYRRAQFVASDIVRAEHRRRTREQEAQAMQEISRPTIGDADWQKLAPVLDQAIGELAAPDRDAVVLRFFEGRPFAEIGTALRLTDDAARMRVERALDKLRTALARRGITSTTAALGIALANQAAATAPAGIAASVAGAALAAATATATATASAGAWLTFLTMSKIKIGVVSAIVAAIAVTGVVELRANRELPDEYHRLQTGSDEIGRLRKENQQLNSALKKLGEKNPEAAELARLNQRAVVLRARPPGLVDSDMKAASAWRNVGQATPEAANETFHWAILTGNIGVLANFVVFTDDTPENRAAFMSHFSDAVRARYQTPEMIAAAPYLGKSTITTELPVDAFAVTAGGDNISTERNPFRRMRLWYRSADGSEHAGATAWQSTSHGWVPTGTFSLSDPQDPARFIDPATGDPLPNRVPIDVGR